MGGLRSGELAAAAGVNRETLRYYERRGLLAEPARTLGGHRLYPAESVTHLKVIKAAQRLGFSLDEIGELLALTRPGLAVRAERKLSEVEARIADLAVIRDSLRAVLRAGCDDLVECAANPACPVPTADGHTVSRAAASAS